MSVEASDLRILRPHETCANRCTILCQLFILALFAGNYWLLEQFSIDAAERAAALVLLAVMVLAATVWQAVGRGVARVYMLLDGVDLQGRARRGE